MILFTQKLDGKNSSSGGAIGASIGFGSSGAGLSIFANANKGTGSEKGNGTTWTETTLDAGKQVSLISGRDTALKGAQVNADKITANVGRDLTLQSLQDSDDYKSKQTDVSGGASVAIIGLGASGNLSVSKNKIDSKYQSVQEQTGLFSGKGGYQVDVKNHTQLDGSVIASTADADKNRLSTGTLGWTDIKNKADYTSKLQSASVSSSNDGAGKFFSNMPSGTLIAFNHGDSASGTTSSAISKGTLDIRDPGKQQQDVATLSHDVEHANDSISPIFDKEKEQKRLQQVRLIGEIGTQTIDIVRTQGQIDADKEARAELDKRGIKEPGKDVNQEAIDQYKKQLIATDAYQRIMADYGVGGNYPRVAQAVTAALQGLVGGDIGSALAGASAPYLAQEIKRRTGENTALNAMAHAVLGAVVAQVQGNSALSGAAGAATGEFIAHQLYPGKETADLTQEQKETVVALSGLAAGLAGGLAGGDLDSAVTGAQAGSNAVQNNYFSLPSGLMNYGQAVVSWSQYAIEKNLTPEQTQAGLDSLIIGKGPSWGITYKVKPYIKTEAAAGFGLGYYLDAGVDPNQFTVNRGETLVIGRRLSAQIGIQFGPYFSEIGATDRNNTFSVGAGVGNVEVSYGKDGVGFGLGVGPSSGWSGVSKAIGDQQININSSSGTEAYHYNFIGGEER